MCLRDGEDNKLADLERLIARCDARGESPCRCGFHTVRRASKPASPLLMGAALIVSVSSVTVLVITASLALRRHERVRRERHEAPEDRYRRAVANIRENRLPSIRAQGWLAAKKEQ